MVDAVPSLETVITAVKAALEGIPSIGTVLDRDHTLEDDVEWLEVNNYLAATMDLWVIDTDPSSPFEGQGVKEGYDRYNIRIRYWSIRTNDPDWQKAARIKARAALAVLTDNPAVFEISGQVQLFTPTTVSMEGPYPAQIRDVARAGGQMVYEAVLRLTVEARAWGVA